jgi:hypothetical protein
LTKREQNIVLDAIINQLSYQANVETRNRKRMRSNPLACWELRVGNLRIYYDVEEDQDKQLSIVAIRAVGIKQRNKVVIGGQEIEL